MSDPYRDVTHHCPSCADPMRTFGQRLCCDTCTGMFLTRADLVNSLVELTSSEVAIDFVPRKITEKWPCPTCEQPLAGCWLSVSVGGKPARTIDVPLLRCERDGVWFGKLALPRLFELVHAIVSTPTYGHGKRLKFGRDKL